MPRKPLPIWAAVWTLLLFFIPVNLIYWDRVLRSAPSQAEADFATTMTVAAMVVPLFMMPIAFFVTYFCVQRYNPAGGLLVWRPDRPVRSILLTLVFGLPALFVALLSVRLIWTLSAWQDLPLLGWELLCVAWLLMLRAAAINQHPDEPPDPDIFA